MGCWSADRAIWTSVSVAEYVCVPGPPAVALSSPLSLLQDPIVTAAMSIDNVAQSGFRAARLRRYFIVIDLSEVIGDQQVRLAGRH
jgi:hypothetical protein